MTIVSDPSLAASHSPDAAPAEPPADTDRRVKATDTLLPVLRVIPEECYVRSDRKAWQLVARAVVIWSAVMAGLASTNAWYLVLPLWVFATLAVTGLFILGHDCAHGALFESKERNRSVGRALMIPSLHIYESWVIGHNRIHHGHTLRQGMDFVWHPTTVEEYRNLGRAHRARHRVEWSAFGSGLYYLRSVWWQKMIRFTAPARYAAAVHRDRVFLSSIVAITTIATGVLAMVLGGSVVGAFWLVTKLFVVPFFGFCCAIGYIVYLHHIAPDIKWWPRRTWNSFHGQIEGTTVLRVNNTLNSLFFYNIFVHVPHHVDVRIPCYELPKAADAIIEAFPEVSHGRYRFADFLASTRVCKLYDFETQAWLPYEAVTGAD